VVVVALTCALGFWRSLQKIDFQFTHERLSGGANIVLATPLFALLALIGFAWISYSHPISVSLGGAAPGDQAAVPGQVTMIGASPAAPAETPAAPPTAGWAEARALLRSLNCLAIGAEAEGLAIAPRERNTLTALRLALMEPHWSETWGDRATFRAWAEAGGTAPAPDPEAAAAYA
jgi:hypothetical protein